MWGSLDDEIESVRRHQQWLDEQLKAQERQRADRAAEIQRLQRDAVERLKGLPGGQTVVVVAPAKWYQFGDDDFGESDECWSVTWEGRCWVLEGTTELINSQGTETVPAPLLLLENGDVVKLRAERSVTSLRRGTYATRTLPAATADWAGGGRDDESSPEIAKHKLAELIVRHDRRSS